MSHCSFRYFSKSASSDGRFTQSSVQAERYAAFDIESELSPSLPSAIIGIPLSIDCAKAYLLASGVQIEAYSVEDKGKGVSFNVYCYNVQPGITIDYTNGDSKLSDGTIASITLNYTQYALEVGQSKTLVAVTSPESAVKSVPGIRATIKSQQLVRTAKSQR